MYFMFKEPILGYVGGSLTFIDVNMNVKRFSRFIDRLWILNPYEKNYSTQEVRDSMKSDYLNCLCRRINVQEEELLWNRAEVI